MNTNSTIETTKITVDLRELERDCELLYASVVGIEKLTEKYLGLDAHTLFDCKSSRDFFCSLTNAEVKFINEKCLDGDIDCFESLWGMLYDLAERLNVQHDMIYNILEIARERAKDS